jgi:hypothetical protein
MPYDGGLSQETLQTRSASVAQSIYNALTQMQDYGAKVLSWADGRTDAQLAQWIIDTDKDLDTKRFPDAASLEVFVADMRALSGALDTIQSSVSANDLADIVKFA